MTTCPSRPCSEALRTPAGTLPDLDVERSLSRVHGPWIAGCDEVGRGALAGPVSVGMCLLNLDSLLGQLEAFRQRFPGLRDSKRIPAGRREALSLLLRDAGGDVSCSVGHASAAEVDAFGLVPALSLAARRALAALPRIPDAVVLDGNSDWFSLGGPGAGKPAVPAVHLVVRGDDRCSTVSAASVAAKVERDALMSDLHHAHPSYGWDKNKGYGSAAHRAAISERGATEYHRRSWKLAP